jgi:hypothetical protein
MNRRAAGPNEDQFESGEHINYHKISSDILFPIVAGIPSLQHVVALSMSDSSDRRGSITPTDDNEQDSKESSAPPLKRRLVRTACLPCRKRKSKVGVYLAR